MQVKNTKFDFLIKTVNMITINTHYRRKPLLAKTFIMLTTTLLLLFLLPGFIAALKDVSVTIPQAVKRGSNALLICNYDMENDTLYSVKWYKGRREFYRYTPKENPAMKVFTATSGLNVERNLSNQSQVVLLAVPLNISGKFTCEISVEAPFFTTAMVSGEMEVVELPEQQATVTGIQPRYRIGDLVDGNCSIKYSKPAANLTWTINGIVVPPHYIKTYQIEKYEEHNLESVVSAIYFMVTTQHFIKGQMKLKCKASIFNIYTEEIENIIEEDRPRIMASGRSYDVNAYPYDQHASGDGFEDHNESYLTYYSAAADVTSSATPSARLKYTKMTKIFSEYYADLLQMLAAAFLPTSPSSASPPPSSSSSSSAWQPSRTSQQPSRMLETAMTAAKILLPTTPTYTLLTTTSIKRNVKRFIHGISKRFKAQIKLHEHGTEINAMVKESEGSKNINGDNCKDNYDDDDDDDGVGADDDDDDGDDSDISWRSFNTEFVSSTNVITYIDNLACSIILGGLSVALLLKYLQHSQRVQHQQQQQLHQCKKDEDQHQHSVKQPRKEQQQEGHHHERLADQRGETEFQQHLKSRSCQNKAGAAGMAATTAVLPAYPWLFNDFLSPHQVYTLQQIKALKCFRNGQSYGERYGAAGRRHHPSSIETILKCYRTLCRVQMSMMSMLTTENAAEFCHFRQNEIEGGVTVTTQTCKIVRALMLQDESMATDKRVINLTKSFELGVERMC